MVNVLIPKTIFQIKNFKQPKFILDKLESFSIGWNYIHFDDSNNIIEFIKNNLLEDLIDISSNIILINNSPIKLEFFIYYYLYQNGGVYLNSDSILNKNIDNIINELSSFYVESCITKLVFNGFIGTIPKNKIFLNVLQKMYNMIILDNYSNYQEMLKDFYRDILINENILTKIFTEDINSEYCKILDNNEQIVTHYYNNDFNNKYNIYNSIETYKYFNKPKELIKIGITIMLPKRAIELFINGLNQNIFYLCELLLNIGYDCRFVVNDDVINNIDQNELDVMLYDKRIKIIKLTEIFKEELDILIIMGNILHDSIIKLLKKTKTIVLGYFCGNSYIIDSEIILYKYGNFSKGTFQYLLDDHTQLYDEIWSIPQMANTNIHYWKTFHRCNTIEVPFVWSNKGINMLEQICNKPYEYYLYKNNNKEKKIAVFEPSISIMKWCLPPLLVCENAYRQLKDKSIINNVYLNNVLTRGEAFNNEAFNMMVESLDLKRDNKCSLEYRYNSLDFLKGYADICVSHSWENGLNYLYLDLAWMGWPVLHNGHLCKDVGYYYDQFNYEEGGNMLVNILNNHDNNINEYLQRNRKAIDRYLPSNKDLQNHYEDIINKLLHNNKQKYGIKLNHEIIVKSVIPEIPLNIFQVWHSNDLLPSIKECSQEIQKLNPEFNYYLFNEESCREFIKQNFQDNVLYAFDNLIPYAFKFDLWRYCILYLKGGIYLDIKYKPLNSFKFINLIDKEYFCEDIEESFKGVYNAFIICKPRNILMLNAINKIVEHVLTKNYCNYGLEVSGPLMLKKLINDNNIKINITDLHLYSDKIEDNKLIIYNNDKPILRMHENYRNEQLSNGKHWAYQYMHSEIFK
uniref:Glycosyltransferase n=1 Tax=viral metagenome TaxID=1070528 RepID=A0A6C0IX90_9ZZZZ